MSRPRVDKSSEQDFIKVILAKNQGRIKRNKKKVKIKKSKYVELDRTYYCIRKFNMALSLCRVLRVTLYFSESFSEAAASGSAVTKVLWPLGTTIVCFLEQKSNL